MFDIWDNLIVNKVVPRPTDLTRPTVSPLLIGKQTFLAIADRLNFCVPCAFLAARQAIPFVKHNTIYCTRQTASGIGGPHCNAQCNLLHMIVLYNRRPTLHCIAKLTHIVQSLTSCFLVMSC